MKSTPYKTPATPTNTTHVIGYGRDDGERLPVQTIQKTSKRWKLLTIVGEGECVIGVVMMALRLPNLPIRTFDVVANVGLVLLGSGFLLALYSELRAWWHHA